MSWAVTLRASVTPAVMASPSESIPLEVGHDAGKLRILAELRRAGGQMDSIQTDEHDLE